MTLDELQNGWRDHYLQWWAAGMPAFKAPVNDPAKELYIKFKTKEDREEFAKIIGQDLTEKTNVISFPFKERDQNMLNRYVED